MLVLSFGSLLALSIWNFTKNLIRLHSFGAIFSVAFVSSSASLLVSALIVVLTLFRSQPIGESATWTGRISSIAGTYLSLLLPLMPQGYEVGMLQAIGSIMIAIGLCGSAYCLSFLGRSFSIDAQARELVSRGPYAFVRHPLYVAELFAMTGLVLIKQSLPALGLLYTIAALQFWRARNEERVLSAFIPSYASYMKRVPMFFPRLGSR